MKNIYIIMTIVSVYALLLGCSNEPKTDKKLNGLSESQVIKELGNPDNELIFILSDSTLLEFRYSLANKFPNYKDETIEIKEWAWEQERKSNLVIWFIKKNGVWISTDNLLYGKNIQI